MPRIDEQTVRGNAAAEWNESAALRAEFAGDFKAYEAYAVANAKGLVAQVAGRVVSPNSVAAARAARTHRTGLAGETDV